MKIIVVGASGTIGSSVVKELSARHEVIKASRTSGDLLCDIESKDSIQKMYEQVKDFDAVISCTGNVHFEDFAAMTDEKYQVGLQSKLMGQVNLVLLGAPLIRDRGSFTLTSGVLSFDPIRSGSSGSMVNAALEGFVKACAIELARGIRINAVSPGLLEESKGAYGSYFQGFEPVPAAKVARAYSKSAEGLQTGKVYDVV